MCVCIVLGEKSVLLILFPHKYKPGDSLHGGKSSQPVLEDVDLERVVGLDVDIDAQVKLAAVDEEGLGQVALDDDRLASRDLAPLVDDTDADAAGRGRLQMFRIVQDLV